MTLAGSTVQKLGSSVSVTIGCPSEACHATVTGSVRTPTLAHRTKASARTYSLGTVSAAIGKGGRATLKLKLGAGLRAAARQALRAGRKLSVVLTVRAADSTGNATTLHRQVRLRR